MTSLEVASPFDQIRRENECGEYWSARELMPILGYISWDRVPDVIERAKLAVNNAGFQAPDHVRASSVMIEVGKGARRAHLDYHLTRFGAYMVAMNGDVRKEAVAKAQTYFAVRTREAEVAPKPTALQIEPTKIEALRGWADELEKRQLAEAKVAVLEPAAEAWESLSADGSDFSIREAAQVLSRDSRISIGQNQLFGYLRQIGWIDRTNAPYQSQVDIGRLVRRVTDYTDDFGQRFVRVQPRVTAKGVEALLKRLSTDELKSLPGGAA